MKGYVISPKTVKALVPHHAVFQAAISEIAHQKLGLHVETHRGCGFYEGGVRVGRRSIQINPGNVVDRDRPYGARQASREEIATAEAIEEISKLFEQCGKRAFEPYKDLIISGDPLRNFFKGYAISGHALP